MTVIQLESIHSKKEKKGYKDRPMKVEASNGNLVEENGWRLLWRNALWTKQVTVSEVCRGFVPSECKMHSTAPGDTENLRGQGRTNVALVTRARGLYLIWYELESHQMLEDLVTMPEVEPISHIQ